MVIHIAWNKVFQKKYFRNTLLLYEKNKTGDTIYFGPQVLE